MLRIIHISDTHNNSRVIAALNRQLYRDLRCDVVAHTGDMENQGTKVAPKEWNNWPHRFKLSVPGNHDKADHLYKNWNSWQSKPPYAMRVKDLLFIGLPLSPKEWGHSIARVLWQYTHFSAVVLLSHYPPCMARGEEFGDIVLSIRNDMPVLFLHGHDHPNEFKGHDWKCLQNKDMHDMFVSHICSAAKDQPGLVQDIMWDGTTFIGKPYLCK